MENEADLKAKYQSYSQAQLIDVIYSLNEKISHLEEVNANLSRMHFGKKSEKIAEGQLSLFNEAEETIEDAKAEDLEEPAQTITYTRKKGKKRNLKDLPVKETHLYPESTICDKCGSQMKEVKPEVSDYLVYKPAEYYIERIVNHVYVCDKCSKETDSFVTKKADTSDKVPSRLFYGSIITPSVLANIAYQKFVMDIPYYRQEKDFSFRNLQFSRQNICNWIIKGGDQYLRFVVEKMMEDMRLSHVLHFDETTLEVLENIEERQKSYVWLAMTGEKESKQMAIYSYSQSREYATVERILGGTDWSGVMQSDGYQAYASYNSANCLKVGCWSHSRRKIYEALTSETKVWNEYRRSGADKRKEILEQSPRLRYSLELINKVDKLFAIEKRLKEENASIEQIFNVRNEEAPEIINSIINLCKEIKDNFAPTSKLALAASYIINQKEYLENYIKDGEAAISNNLAEREGIKPFVMARKNFLFSATENGAEISCMYFSLLISAIMNNLNPIKYLQYVFEDLSTFGLKEEVIKRVLPYSQSIPSDIRIRN